MTDTHTCAPPAPPAACTLRVLSPHAPPENTRQITAHAAHSQSDGVFNNDVDSDS